MTHRAFRGSDRLIESEPQHARMLPATSSPSITGLDHGHRLVGQGRPWDAEQSGALVYLPVVLDGPVGLVEPETHQLDHGHQLIGRHLLDQAHPLDEPVALTGPVAPDEPVGLVEPEPVALDEPVGLDQPEPAASDQATVYDDGRIPSRTR